MGMEHYARVKDLGGTNGAFLARDRHQPDRLVVIKRLADGTQGIEELNASLRLRHPHIIRFLESFVFEGNLYVVMSYEPGGDLDELFRYLTQRHKTPTTHTLLLWFVQLLEALVYCHDNHVIHRDVKPGNILVSEDTKLLYLGDFGSAKTLSVSNVTSTFVGSPMWISPEVLLGTSYGYPADVWSMGCVFYEMAALRKPFSAPSFAHLVQQITRGHITPLSPQTSPDVTAIVYSMLVLDPAQRTTARAALEVARVALDRAEEHRRASPRPVRSPAMPSSATCSPPRPAPLPAPSAPSSSSPSRSPTPPPAEELAETAAPPPPPSPPAASPRPTPAPSEPATPPPPPSSVASEPRRRPAEAKAGEDPTPHGAPPASAAERESPSPAVVMKRRPGATSSASTSVQSMSSAPPSSPTPAVAPPSTTSPPHPPVSFVVEVAPAPSPPPAAAAPVAAAAAPPAEEAEAEAEPEEAHLYTPHQMVIQIPTAGFFNKPAPRKKKAAPKRSSAAAAAAAAAASAQKAGTPPPRQRVSSIPAPPPPPTEAPKFVRQLTSDSLAGRRAPAAAHASAVEARTPSRRGRGGAEAEAKAVPPTHVARRALAAADNLENPPQVPRESPTRAASRGYARPQATPAPMVPAKPAGAQTDQWFDQRMRDLCAMENYLHQHRGEDNKALQTYDARRHAEEQQQQQQQRRSARPSPAPRRHSPARESAGATPSRRHQPSEAAIPAPPPRPQRPTASSAERRPGAASPFARQASYARQGSHHGYANDSRQSSLSSTFNGRQASNARARPRVSLEEQLKGEEERVVAREKREAERQRMKELISAQRAAAKQQNRKSKKGGSVDVEFVLPEHMQHGANGA